MKKVTNTVIIAFYKRLDFLKKILEGLKEQSCSDFELIVAEDDNSPATYEFINGLRKDLPFTVKLVSHEDKGFRKNKILNDALKISLPGNILFLDGDCIPHKHFVRHYSENIKPGTAFFGRRVMLDEKFTSQLVGKKGLDSLNLFRLLFTGSKKIEDGLYFPLLNKTKKEYRGIWGCNWGISLEDLQSINGFDEDYVHATVGEDVDIEWRLRFRGVVFRSLKHKAIVYHLYHKENYNYDVTLKNLELFEKKKLLQSSVCLNGLKKNPNIHGFLSCRTSY